MTSNTIALAVDGMEPTVTSQWVEKGDLPNFRSLIDSGVWGTAECTSLSSAKQWTSHFTGVNPDRHGVTGFLKSGQSRQAGEVAPDVRELINLSDIQVMTYPELLSERGVRVGLINPLPLWPPLELTKGYCVSGMLTPPEADRWAYPESLQSILTDMGYKIDIRYGNRPYGFVDDEVFNDVSLEQLEQDLFEVLEARLEFAKYAWSEYTTDFSYVLIKTIDVFQHCFWIHMQRNDPQFGDTIFKAYRRVDSFLGWLREEFDANLVVFSDHGFKSRPSPPPRVLGQLARWLDHLIDVPNPIRETYRTIFGGTTVESGPVEKISGVHADPAMWLLSGPDIVSANKQRIGFDDLTPTIMALLDQPIPTEYVGTALDGLLSTSSKVCEIDISTTRSGITEPESRVTERLHNLGYAEMVDEDRP